MNWPAPFTPPPPSGDPGNTSDGAAAAGLDRLYERLNQWSALTSQMMRLANDQRLERHFVQYATTTTSNPLPAYTTAIPSSNQSLDDSGGGDGAPELFWPVLPLAVFIFISVVGNMLVCLAVWRDKRLQSMTNYFLFSLAVADLGVAAFVMPLALVNSFTGSWLLGPIMCNLWTTMDVTFCTSSIMHLCTIQLDRYLAISVPVFYGEMNRSKRWAGVKMFLVWFLSSCVGGTLFALSLHTQENSYRFIGHVHVCAIFNDYIMLYGSLAAFYVPFLLMMILYSLTAYALRQRSLRNKRTQAKRAASSGGGSGVVQNGASASAKSAPGIKVYLQLKPKSPTTPAGGGANPTASSSDNIEPYAEPTAVAATPRTGGSSNTTRLGTSPSPGLGSSVHATSRAPLINANKKRKDQKENERRAQMILLIVFVSFVLLWFPFFAINIIIPLCEQCAGHIDPKWIDFTTWMGYVSSMLNPIIYTIFNRLFREAFTDVLLCRNPQRRMLKRMTAAAARPAPGRSPRLK